jgi:hypothetical protein
VHYVGIDIASEMLAELAARGFPVALINPVRTRRFAGEDLERTSPTPSTRSGSLASRYRNSQP